jgi:hypothetical protein
VVDLVDAEGDLGRVRLDPRLAEIGDEGVDQPILLLDEQGPELAQLLAALVEVTDDAGAEAVTEPLDDVGDSVDVGHGPRLGARRPGHGPG